MESPDSHHRASSRSWAVAVTIIAVVAILCTTAYLVVRSMARIPEAAVEQTRELLAAAEELAEAFRQGTIENRFVSYASSISGSTYLQVATVDRIEVFTREDRAAIFWGAVQLPDVVVSATAPVQYTAYVDFEEPWHLRLEDSELLVTAPTIRFNQPSFDASKIEFEVREGSFLRDEDAALAELKRGLMSMSHQRTQDLEPVVKSTGREKIAEFVRNWLLLSFPQAEEVEIEVVFADEIRPQEPVLRQRPTD